MQVPQMGEYHTMQTDTQLIDMFLQHLEGRSFSAFTIRRRRSSLTTLARWAQPLPLLELDGPAVEEWVGTHQSANTRHAYRSDVAAFFRWAQRRKLVDANPVDDTDGVRVPKTLPRPVPADAVRLIVNSAPTLALRTGLAVAAYAGLRRSEIVHLTTADVSLHSRPPVLMVRQGKWAKDREVPIHPELLEHLSRRTTGGRFVPMTPDQFGRQAATHIRACGYNMTVHSLRATFATELARITAGNVLLVGKMLGHENMNTTSGYIGVAAYAGSEQVANMYPGDAA